MAKDLGLILFCWGDDNNCKDTIKYLKEKGLHAIIFDKVDVLIESKVRVYYHFQDELHEISASHNLFEPDT